MTQFVFPITSAEATDPDRFGPKTANLAALGHAGLPIPEGFSLDALAYQAQLNELGLDDAVRGTSDPDIMVARRCAIKVRLGLLEQPITAAILEPLLAARRVLLSTSSASLVVRSSALVEDRFGSSFAGQFESYLGLTTEDEFITAVRACWAALWSPRVLRYMAGHDASPAETAMAVLIQPLVAARASGGGLSLSADGGMILSATWGLGSAIAQGEVVPDRYILSDNGQLQSNEAGRKNHRVGCHHHHHGDVQHSEVEAVSGTQATAMCLSDAQAVELGGLLRKAEDCMGLPVEIEWAIDNEGFKLLQARPLHMEPAPIPDEIWLRHPALQGQPAGVGWGTGRACVVNCECELARVGPGDILITKVAGPALSQILPRVAGVVAELGGSTSHLASLARERGIPMVLGVLNATQRIPDGMNVAVDGVAGVVRWMPA